MIYRLRRGIPLAGILLCWIPMTFAQGVDSATGTSAVFQLEGNATSDSKICFRPSTGTGSSVTNPSLATPGAGDSCPSGFTLVTFGTANDWGSPGSPLAATAIPLTDLTNSQSDTSFIGGSSKDIYDISQWTWKGAKASQAKDDIAHAYALAYLRPSDNHVILLVGLDRWDNSGNATAGFWILKDSTIKLNNTAGGGADGRFDGGHKDGDLLIVSDFTTGGAVSNIAVYKWVGNGTSGSLQPLGGGVSNGNATCNPVAGNNAEFCGISNPVTVSSPWSFLDKDGSTNFRQGEFLEIAVDLNHPNVFGNSTACFSTFLAETRASSAANSTLSDFSGPAAFSLCNVSITKTCTGATIVSTNGGGQAVDYTFTGNVVNSGAGTIYDPFVTDTPPTGCTVTSLIQPTATSIARGASASYSGTLRCSGILGMNDINKVSVVAASSSGGAKDIGPEKGDWGPTTCSPPVVGTLTLSKNCESCLVSGSGGLLVKIGEGFKVCNSPNSNVTINNISVRDCRGTISGTAPAQTCSTGFASITMNATALPPGACATGTSSYNPSSIGTCATGTEPACTFTDFAIASGTTALTSAAVYANDGQATQATCPLCPLGDCSPPPITQ
jgi:hypothetical protein